MSKVLVASAATVAVTFAGMYFNKLRALGSIGPACAIGVLVGLAAAMTLLPPVLAVGARFGIGYPKNELTQRHWRRVAIAVVRRPGPLLTASLVLLLALASAASALQLNADDRRGQSATTASNEGYELLNRHFPRDIVFSDFVLVHSTKDLRTARGLADLDEMASRIAQLPGVERVTGITRPTGQRLEQAQISWQNGQIGDKMTESVDDAQSHRADLDQLAAGADQLADGMTELHHRLRDSLTPFLSLFSQIDDARRQLGTVGPLLDALEPGSSTDSQQTRFLQQAIDQAKSALDSIEPALKTLGNSPWCLTAPECSRAKESLQALSTLHDHGFFDQLAEFVDQEQAPNRLHSLIGAAHSMNASLGTLGDQSDDLPGQIRQLENGIGRLAEGARTLSIGVHALVGSNIEQMAELSRVAAQLRETASAATGSDSSSGFFLPPTAIESRDFSAAARIFISKDGRTARYAVKISLDPYSPQAGALASRIKLVANAAFPNTSLSEATAVVTGFTAFNADVQALLTRDTIQTIATTLTVVAIILLLLLRSVVAPLYLVGTVVLNYLASLGIGVLILQYGLHQQIHSAVPLLAFSILVAVGADYNMLLVSRLRDESATSFRIGVLRTVASTGSVITAAGMIFAASMFGVLIGSVQLMPQVGCVVGTGLLLDTFLVRTLTVPAIAAILREKNWWPSRP